MQFIKLYQELVHSIWFPSVSCKTILQYHNQDDHVDIIHQSCADCFSVICNCIHVCLCLVLCNVIHKIGLCITAIIKIQNNFLFLSSERCLLFPFYDNTQIPSSPSLIPHIHSQVLSIILSFQECYKYKWNYIVYNILSLAFLSQYNSLKIQLGFSKQQSIFFIPE